MSESSDSNSSSDSSSNSSSSTDVLNFDTQIEFAAGVFEKLVNNPPLDVLALLQAEEASSSRRRKKKNYVRRDRWLGNEQLMKDYFNNPPVYPAEYFRRRFRMRRELFLRIVNEVVAHDPYFQQRPDAAGKPGLSSLQECTAALRQLAYGGGADSLDEYLRMGQSTAVKCLKRFCLAICEVFGEVYLRRPTASDIQRLYQMHEERHGFPGMLGSIDCMHWTWKNCPVAWKGQYTRGDKGVPTLMLEAVASYDLWIWHAFFGVAGSNNDINVLNQSDVFTDVLRGEAPSSSFQVNGNTYRNGYYLADGIYPEWSVFVKSYAHPQDAMRILFKRKQESARKDVERAFGVLQARWGIIRSGAKFWYQGTLKDIMYTCIILHNMIIEDEGSDVNNWCDDAGDEQPSTVQHGPVEGFQSYIDSRTDMHSRQTHHQLRTDLMSHIWAIAGGDESEI